MAQTDLGLLYEQGRGVLKSPSQAVKWYRKAAEQGNAYAQFFLGLNYYDGIGVTKNKNEAIKWLTKASDQGVEDAKLTLDKIQQGETEASEDEYFYLKAGAFILGALIVADILTSDSSGSSQQSTSNSGTGSNSNPNYNPQDHLYKPDKNVENMWNNLLLNKDPLHGPFN